MKSLIVFAGAGASRGVSGEKYPMALDFRRRLPEEIKTDHLYVQLHKHLARSGLGEEVDIEHVLWELGRLSEAITEWTDPSRFASRLLSSNQISQVSPSSNSGPAVHGQFEQLRNVINRLQDRINERVYDFYSQTPSVDELQRSWLPLLEHLASQDIKRIDIVTTNYDLVIEEALEALNTTKISMGLRQGVLPGVNLNAWRSLDSSSGMLTKLHGSVDWKLGNGSTDVDPVIRRGHPEFDGDHKKRLILYPGFKGVPSREPFVAFHEYFRRRIQEATHLLFIGFAFRDAFINDLIGSAIPPNSCIAVVNPAPGLPALSFLRNALHLQKGFGIERVVGESEPGALVPFTIEDLKEWLA